MFRALRDQRRAPLVWGGSLGLMSALMVAIYPSLEEDLQKAVESYPEGLKETFRVDEIDSAAAYLDTEMFSLIVPLAIGVFAVRSVSRAIAGAEERRYLDVVLSAPVTRTQLLTGTLLATAAVSAAILAVTGALAWLGSVVAGAGLGLGTTAEGVASVWPLGLFCAGMAAAASGFLHRSAAVTALAVGVFVAMYVVDIVGKLEDSLDWLRYSSVFRWYGAALKDGIDLPAFIGVAAAAAVLGALATRMLERRDVTA
jgi:ABC-2 type transport system permease protein